MIYPIDFRMEDAVHKLFEYQTRIGISRKFDTLPIGWYQSHQCAAYDVVIEALQGANIKEANIKTVFGMMYAYPINPKRKRVLLFQDIRKIYREASERCTR